MIKPFENVPYVDPGQRSEELAVLASQMGGQQKYGNFEYLQVGAGLKAFKVDPDGMWLGSEVMADAPFSSDMLGNVVLNSVVINGLSGAVIAGAIDENGFLISALISSTLDTQSKEILGEFTFSGSGAIAIKTDNDNGIWLSPTGILAKKAGATTFALETDGDATFSGALVGASGTFGTITAGTITGVTVQSGTTGYRSVITSENGFQLYYNTTYRGKLTNDVNGVVLDTIDNIYFRKGATEQARLVDAGFQLPAGRSFQFTSGRKLTDASSAIECNGDFNPSSDEGNDLGYASKKWNNVRAQTIWQQTNTDGSRHVYDFAYIEKGLIDEKLLKKLAIKSEGLETSNGYLPDLKLPFRKGAVLKWTANGLRESENESDMVVAVASEKGLPIVLGAEPVMVWGKSKIGDLIIPSSKKGYAKAINRKDYDGITEIIGKCLENKNTSGGKLIKVMINF